MATQKNFRQAGYLARLEQCQEASIAHGDGQALALLQPVADAQPAALSEAGQLLVNLLEARKAMLQAEYDTELSADELRRYQKFSPKGRPSIQIVQLRKLQAAAQQASRRSRQDFTHHASGFVRAAGLTVPGKQVTTVFVEAWINKHLPKDPLV